MDAALLNRDLTSEMDAHRRLMERRQREWVVLGVFLGLVLLFGANFKVVRVDGISMEPTYHDGDTLIVWRTASLFRSYKVGDPIVLTAPDTGDELLKRIAFIQNASGTNRLPQQFWTPEGYVSLQDVLSSTEALQFPEYTQDIARAQSGIPVRKTIYVMGDNVWRSSDSRDFGPVAPDAVMGTVICLVGHAAPTNPVFARSHSQRQRHYASAPPGGAVPAPPA
jgi:signal peptidase I